MPLVGDPVDIPYFDVTVVETSKLQWCYDSGEIATNIVFAILSFGECERESPASLPSVCIGVLCYGARLQILVVSNKGGLIFEQPRASVKK